MASTKTTAFGFSLILTLGFGSPASAQRLDLDDGPEPPVLTRSVLDDIAERFADDGGDRRNEAGSLNVIAEARRNLRRIAVELAHRGGGAGDAAMVAGLQAIRLVANISEFDAMLDALARPGTFVGSPPRPISQESRDAAIERLRDFNRSGLDHLRRSDTGTLPRLDATLSTVLAPIRRAISLISDRPIITRWPNEDSIRSSSERSDPALGPLPDRADVLEADLAMARSDEGGSGTDALRRRQLLRSSVQAIESIETGTNLRDRLEEILNATLLRLIDDPSDRRGGLELLVVTQGARISGAIDDIADRASSSEFDPDRFRVTLDNALIDPIDDSTNLLLERQHEILMLLKAGIDALAVPIDRDLRNAQREIHRRHRRGADRLARVGTARR